MIHFLFFLFPFFLFETLLWLLFDYTLGVSSSPEEIPSRIFYSLALASATSLAVAANLSPLFFFILSSKYAILSYFPTSGIPPTLRFLDLHILVIGL